MVRHSGQSELFAPLVENEGGYDEEASPDLIELNADSEIEVLEYMMYILRKFSATHMDACYKTQL